MSEGQPISIKETLVDTHESPFENAAQEEVRARVEEKIGLVSEPFRTVVIFRDIEGFTYEEIAEILDLNVGTVKSRLMRGRAQLKALLAPFAEAAAKRPACSSRDLASFAQLSTEEAQ